MLQRVDAETASLQLWTQDGQQWSADPNIVSGNLPPSGNMRVLIQSDEIRIYIDQLNVLNVEGSTLMFSDGALGIRWAGAVISLKPFDDAGGAN